MNPSDASNYPIGSYVYDREGNVFEVLRIDPPGIIVAVLARPGLKGTSLEGYGGETTMFFNRDGTWRGPDESGRFSLIPHPYINAEVVKETQHQC
jgi:hypothetical protein